MSSIAQELESGDLPLLGTYRQKFTGQIMFAFPIELFCLGKYVIL
jgi:hypothetical protein